MGSNSNKEEKCLYFYLAGIIHGSSNKGRHEKIDCPITKIEKTQIPK